MEWLLKKTILHPVYYKTTSELLGKLQKRKWEHAWKVCKSRYSSWRYSSENNKLSQLWWCSKIVYLQKSVISVTPRGKKVVYTDLISYIQSDMRAAWLIAEIIQTTLWCCRDALSYEARSPVVMKNTCVVRQRLGETPLHLGQSHFD